MAYNRTRAAGALASVFHAKATTGTIRAQLINVPGRLASSARKLTVHLSTGWPWQAAWEQLATGPRHGPPAVRGPIHPIPQGPTRTPRGNTRQPGQTTTPQPARRRWTVTR